jgi:hypothetical protein
MAEYVYSHHELGTVIHTIPSNRKTLKGKQTLMRTMTGQTLKAFGMKDITKTLMVMPKHTTKDSAVWCNSSSVPLAELRNQSKL